MKERTVHSQTGDLEISEEMAAKGAMVKSSSLHVQEIRDFEQLKSLEKEWNETLDKSKLPLLYLTHEWMVSWWKCLGKNGKQLFVLVVREGNEIIGIAPFMLVKERFLGAPVKKIEFISMMKYADSPTNCAASLDFIIRDRYEQVIETIMSHLNRYRWHFIRLNPVPENSQTIKLLAQEALKHDFEYIKYPVSMNSVIDVDKSWKDYFLSLSKNFRKRLVNNEQKLQQNIAITYRCVQSYEEMKEAFSTILDIEKRSWKWNAGVSINSAAFGDFYKIFVEEASKKERISIWMMKFDEKYIAYDVTAGYKGTLETLKSSYDVAYRKYSPGHLLTLKEFEHFFQNGAQKINLLWGDFETKKRWNVRLEPHDEIFIYHKNIYAKLLYLLMITFSFYHWQKKAIELRNRVARKLHILLKSSELTRQDQLK
ncbi:MAG: GNAT family N-acetyltransferase [Ignavibacteriae bacterium]|nr:GNAT family N-acetyltransferase [Ignavibacteriota bacterium]